MRTKKLLLLLFALALSVFNDYKVKSQETETEVAEEKIGLSVGADIVNRYIWRGMSLSTSAAFQPYVEFSAGGFTMGSWGSYTFAPEPFQEADLYLSYGISYFTLTFNDYFVPIDSIGYNNSYLDWDENTTPHALEAMFTISEIPNFPITFNAAVIIYGNDLDENGDNYYSTYLELAYDFSIGKTNANAFIGATPSKGLYSDDFNVVNLGISASKEIQITDKFSLPIMGAFIVNPNTENAYITFGISL